MALLVAVMALDVFALVLAPFYFGFSGECFIFDFVVVLVCLVLLALVGGDSDDDGRGDVLVVDIAGGGEGVDSGIVGRG